jgi:DNA-binding IclR family transcriptional regulator
MNMKPTKSTKPARHSKSEKILAMLRRNNGATIAELVKSTGWQKQSVHGFISGTLKKKQGLQITSAKEENKDRRYSIAGDGQ